MSVCLFGYRYTSYFISVVFASAYIYLSGISAVSLDSLPQRALHIYMSVLRLWLCVVFLQCPQTHCAASQDNGKMATDGDNRGGLRGSDKLLDR